MCPCVPLAASRTAGCGREQEEARRPSFVGWPARAQQPGRNRRASRLPFLPLDDQPTLPFCSSSPPPFPDVPLSPPPLYALHPLNSPPAPFRPLLSLTSSTLLPFQPGPVHALLARRDFPPSPPAPSASLPPSPPAPLPAMLAPSLASLALFSSVVSASAHRAGRHNAVHKRLASPAAGHAGCVASPPPSTCHRPAASAPPAQSLADHRTLRHVHSTVSPPATARA